MNQNKPPSSTPSPLLSATPEGYAEFLHSVKERVRSARTRAALAVNSELVLLYWGIGRDILTRQREQGWGAKVVERLSADLRREFPEMKGFSRRTQLWNQGIRPATCFI